MIFRVVAAVVIAVIVGLLCTLLGAILGDLHVEIASTVGGFLTRWGWVLGVLAGLWYFATGRTLFTP